MTKHRPSMEDFLSLLKPTPVNYGADLSKDFEFLQKHGISPALFTFPR